jgi:flavin reductase (DIM6/NTAB) family NADH-FMN oxidoreductase RutF
MINSDQFRQVMGHFATGITIVTARDSSGEPRGLTVNSFTSVSLDPLLVLVCLDKRLSSLKAFEESKKFGVSMLSEHQEELSRIFAKRDSERPASLYFDGEMGLPLLKDALAVMECETVAVYPGGDHLIYLGEVKHAQVLHAHEPLLYFRGKYRKLHGLV